MADGDEAFLSRWSRLKREEAKPAQPSAAPVEAPKPVLQEELQPIESLTLESDYRAFLQPGVAVHLRKAALTKLFQDPHFHFAQMDKLDIYIDDYSIEDPISEEMMKTLYHARHILFDEKKTPPEDAIADAAEPERPDADPKQDA